MVNNSEGESHRQTYFTLVYTLLIWCYEQCINHNLLTKSK